jgi:20S proteasome alpha/beta subunit
VTCIIGMYYESGKGALIVADSRTMVGGDHVRGKKVFAIDEEIVFASSGLSGIAEKLVPNVSEARGRLRQTLPSEIVDIFEDQMADLYNRYKMTRPYRFSNDETLLNGIIGFLDKKSPQLHCLYENGYAESMHDFHSVGHGARHARNILRTLYSPSLSKDRALELGIHALLEVAKIDAMVDGCPQIAILEEGLQPKGLEILNQTANGFSFEVPSIETIKTKLEGLEGKRAQAFHLLLDGSDEARKNFDGVLRDYELGKKQNKKEDSGQGNRAKGAAAK